MPWTVSPETVSGFPCLATSSQHTTSFLLQWLLWLGLAWLSAVVVVDVDVRQGCFFLCVCVCVLVVVFVVVVVVVVLVVLVVLVVVVKIRHVPGAF